MQLPKEEHKAFAHYINQLYKLFLKYDFSMLEINPLVVCMGDILALDGKMNFDDNALYKHKEIMVMRDFDEEDSGCF